MAALARIKIATRFLGIDIRGAFSPFGSVNHHLDRAILHHLTIHPHTSTFLYTQHLCPPSKLSNNVRPTIQGWKGWQRQGGTQEAGHSVCSCRSSGKHRPPLVILSRPPLSARMHPPVQSNRNAIRLKQPPPPWLFKLHANIESAQLALHIDDIHPPSQ